MTQRAAPEPRPHEARLPLLVEADEPVDLVSWLAENRETIRGSLSTAGAVLVRGFASLRLDDFQRAAQAVSGELLEDTEQSSPRTSVAEQVYTSTDYPATETIFLHNENSYASIWPLKLFFHCVTPATTGGETPLADVRNVLGRIDPDVRARFESVGWLAVRNFHPGVGLAWQTVFGTSDPDEVEEYCAEHDMRCEWRSDGTLRTRAVRRAVHEHPETGARVWFNHATFWHVSTLPPVIRDALLLTFSEDDLPTNTYYGDGAPIEPDVLDHLREAYRAEESVFEWQQGDVLIVDNMLVAHGRRPFDGERRIVVALGEPSSAAVRQ